MSKNSSKLVIPIPVSKLIPPSKGVEADATIIAALSKLLSGGVQQAFPNAINLVPHSRREVPPSHQVPNPNL